MSPVARKRFSQLKKEIKEDVSSATAIVATLEIRSLNAEGRVEVKTARALIVNKVFAFIRAARREAERVE